MRSSFCSYSVENAGAYSGEYEVQDTGHAIKGHEIDIYVPSAREAKKFGRQPVTVRIIEAARE